MSGSVFEVVFPDGRPLVYELSVGARAMARQWLRPVGPLGGELFLMEVLVEIDRSSAGLDGVRRQRGALVCADDGSARAIRILGPEGARELRFGPGGVGSAFLADPFVPGFSALMLASLAAAARLDRGPVVTARFHLAEEVIAPCTLSGTADGWSSSHEEEFSVDATGLLTAARLPRRGLVARRIDAPLPPWADEPPAAVLASAQVYRPPAGLRVEEIVVPLLSANVAGTLSIPARTPAPGALFIAGTGRPDRHGMRGLLDAGSHEIMDGLARLGVLGLRCDALPAASLAALAAVASAQLDRLAGHELVDPRRLFLVGHSQGGAVALTLAAARPDAIRGVVLLAASGRPFDVVLRDQLRRLAEGQGWPERALLAELEDHEMLVAAAASGRPLVAGEAPDHLLVRARTLPWLAERLAQSNAQRIRAVGCPVLVCQGDQDLQVSMADAQALIDAGRAAGVAVTLAAFAGLDHRFRAGPAAHVPDLVLRRIADWMAEVAP